MRWKCQLREEGKSLLEKREETGAVAVSALLV